MFNIASKYGSSLNKDTEKAIRCFLLLYNLEKYVNGAVIEDRRLNRTRRTIRKDIDKSLKSGHIKRSFHLAYLANDTHFYFICIDKAYKLITALATQLNDSDIEKLANRLNKSFDIKTIRGHLEHIEQRCLGRFPRGNKGKISKNDLGNFIGEDFSFGGKRFPSSKKSMNELKTIYTDLIKILDKKYASQDPAFIWRQQSEQMYKKIMKKLKREGLLQE